MPWLALFWSLTKVLSRWGLMSFAYAPFFVYALLYLYLVTSSCINTVERSTMLCSAKFRMQQQKQHAFCHLVAVWFLDTVKMHYLLACLDYMPLIARKSTQEELIRQYHRTHMWDLCKKIHSNKLLCSSSPLCPLFLAALYCICASCCQGSCSYVASTCLHEQPCWAMCKHMSLLSESGKVISSGFQIKTSVLCLKSSRNLASSCLSMVLNSRGCRSPASQSRKVQ